jgi:hypothetical protein
MYIVVTYKINLNSLPNRQEKFVFLPVSFAVL